MVRLFPILFLLSTTAFAIPGDLNGNGMVGLGDLTIMANSWLTDDGGDLDSDSDTDFADFCILAANWLDGCSVVPEVTASNVTASLAPSGSATVYLQATSTVSLVYRVTSLPTRGTLYDGETDTLIDAVPFVLASESVHYHAESVAGTVTFSWTATTVANDCGQSVSDAAQTAITVYIPPTATAQSTSATTYIWKTITLAATDDGYPSPPGKLKYVISSLPAVGLLYDPKSGAGHINKVPYSLSSWGNDVLYITDAAGNSSFGFKANDGGNSPMGGESPTATVSITTAANPLDCLSFDGMGTVSIPDGTYLDAIDGWAIDFWVKTRTAYATLIDKRGTGAGYEIKMVAGRPYITLYDASGKVGELSGIYRLDFDDWVEVEFCVYVNAGNWFIFYSARNDGYIFNDTAGVGYAGTMPDMTNAESLVVGPQYKGQIDKIGYWSGVTDPLILDNVIQTGDRNENPVLFQKVPAVLWMCDEHSGTTITDIKTSKVGTFNSSEHVAWHPWIVPFCGCLRAL